jgi:hypothetical protein
MMRPWSITLVLFGALIAGMSVPRAEARSAVFGGGPFYSGGTAVMNDLKNSGFTTVMLWSIHVGANGDLVMNDKLVASNGAYVGASTWPGQLATLKQAPTFINRIELSVGSAGVQDWHNVQALVNAQGTGSGSILYRNFQALINATGADAVNDDDEDLQDVNSTVAFGRMIGTLGKKFTLCPYNNTAFWQNVKSQLGTTVDRVYLQVYDGGAGNNAASWNSSLGITVDPGLWSRHGSGCTAGDNPSSVQSKMAGWKSSAGITGGFMWLYDDIQACSSQGTSAQYAAAINNAVGSAPTPTLAPPTPTTAPTPSGANLALNKTATGSAACATTEGPEKAVNGSVSGGNSDKFCSAAATRWLQVDLGGSASITGFVVKHAGAGGESTTYNTRDFNIQVSTDNANWTTVVTVTGNTGSITAHTITTRTARYARLNSTTSTQNGEATTRIYEFEVHGTAGGATATATRTATAGATATRTATATATPASGGGCAGIPAFASCTAYANGASVTYNSAKYHSIAPIPSTRDCPPNSPYNPSNDNWWVNDGGC